MRKSQKEMLDTILQQLITRQGITEITPGSVARTFSEVITEEFYPFYEELDTGLMMSYVSTSRGSYLDLIGQLLDCKRIPEESDSDYRYRISKQVYVVQGANLTALRLEILKIKGVADISFKRFTHGAGSFTCYVIPTEYPITNDIIAKVQAKVDEVAALGIYGEVKTSLAIPVDIAMQIIFQNATTNPERQTVRQQISAGIERYINDLGMGQPIIINEVIEQAMGTNRKIVDMQIVQLVVNDVQQYIRNIYPKSEEEYYLRRISVS